MSKNPRFVGKRNQIAPKKEELYAAIVQALRELERLGATDNDETIGEPNRTVELLKSLLNRAGR